MASLKVASRYAKSIIDLAKEKSLVDAIATDMTLVKEVSSNPDFKLLLKSPIISVEKKVSVFKAIFGDKINGLTLSFLNLLAQKGRESELPNIVDEYIAQYKSIKKIKPATLITAEQMNDAEINTIKSKFSHWLAPGETMEVSQKINPDIIGGYILEMGDKQCDSSIRRQLHVMKTSLYDKSYINLVESK